MLRLEVLALVLVRVVRVVPCWIATDVCSLFGVNHVCHLAVSEFLRLVETCMRVMILASIIDLVLNGSHDEFVGGGLVWHLFRADSSVPLLVHVVSLICTWVLVWSSGIC